VPVAELRISEKSFMQKQFILFCVATLIAGTSICFAQTGPSQLVRSVTNEGAITDLEKSAWNAYKNKQVEAFKNLLSKDYCGAYAEGIKTLDTEVADMAKTDLRDYSFADMKVVFPSADVAVVTYKVTQHATSAGQDVSGTYNTSSVWVKEGGKWLGVLHTEAKVQ